MKKDEVLKVLRPLVKFIKRLSLLKRLSLYFHHSLVTIWLATRTGVLGVAS